MLWFKEVVLFCFLIEIDKRRIYYVALFWHYRAFDLVLRAACRQHRVTHMSHSLPKYYPLTVCSQNRTCSSSLPSAYLLQLLIIYLLSPEKGDFLKDFVFGWSLSATGKPRPLARQVSVSCSGDPSLCSSLDQRVVPVPWGGSHNQSTAETPFPGLLSPVCYSLHALVVSLKDSNWTLYAITPLI